MFKICLFFNHLLPPLPVLVFAPQPPLCGCTADELYLLIPPTGDSGVQFTNVEANR